MSIAYRWEDAEGFPPEIKHLFVQSGKARFKSMQMLIAIPEYKVDLPGGKAPSQNDLFVLAKDNKDDLVAITVEGKVAEEFGPLLKDWCHNMSHIKRQLIKNLQECLGLSNEFPLNIRYQLIHRTASALIMAERFNAKSAVMIVHSFSPEHQWFEDYQEFLSLYGLTPKIGELVYCGKIRGIDLYCGWALVSQLYCKMGPIKHKEYVEAVRKRMIQDGVDASPDAFNPDWLQQMRKIKKKNEGKDRR